MRIVISSEENTELPYKNVMHDEIMRAIIYIFTK